MLVFALFLFLSSSVSFAYDENAYLDGITSYKMAACGACDLQNWIDGALSESAGEGAEWYIIALHQCGEYDFSEYARSLARYVSSEGSISPASGEKYALAFLAANVESSYIKYAADNFIGKGGIMSLIFGLHLINNGIESSLYTKEELISEILSLLLSDGGFAVSGEYSNVDVTAMALSSLAPYYESDGSVRAAVDGALMFLSERQLENGGFSDYGVENCESAAQVLTALCSLGIDPEGDVRFIKNGNTVVSAMLEFSLPDGSFSHKAGAGTDNMATEQAFYALVALKRFKEGKSGLFVLDEQNDATPNDFKDVVFGSGDSVGTTEKDGSRVKNTVCIAVIAVCAAVILILLFKKSSLPEKK